MENGLAAERTSALGQLAAAASLTCSAILIPTRRLRTCPTAAACLATRLACSPVSLSACLIPRRRHEGRKHAAPLLLLTLVTQLFGPLFTSPTDDMKTKNRPDRGGAVPAAPAAAGSAAPAAAAGGKGKAAPAGPPRVECEQGRKWVVENQVGASIVGCLQGLASCCRGILHVECEQGQKW